MPGAGTPKQVNDLGQVPFILSLWSDCHSEWNEKSRFQLRACPGDSSVASLFQNDKEGRDRLNL